MRRQQYKQYIYPKLPAVRTTQFFRIGGNGLANCLFVYAKAIVLAYKYKTTLIAPTWFNISIGTYLRHQEDKRHYFGLINNKNEVCGIKRLWLLMFGTKTTEEKIFQEKGSRVLVVEGIYDFFTPLIEYHELVSRYLFDHINPILLEKVNMFDFSNCVAIHVRLGDFPIERRVPIEWYIQQIKLQTSYKRFLLFSDGTDEELKELFSIEGVERVFFGGAIQDIIAISRCSYLIGSDSSFSAWGAYLGQIPCTFYKFQFGRILRNTALQKIEIQK